MRGDEMNSLQHDLLVAISLFASHGLGHRYYILLLLFLLRSGPSS
jgi:hypothetical protein